MSQAGIISVKGSSPTVPEQFTTNNGIAIPSANNINIFGQEAGTVPVMDTNGSGSTVYVEDRTWLTQYVVDPSATVGLRGTFQTIQSAINAASSPANIYIRDGTYTENPVLVAGVNLISFDVDALNPSVTIIGNCDFTGAGSCAITGIRLQASVSNNAITVNGSSASVLNIRNCFIECDSSPGIVFSSSNALSQINMSNVYMNIGTSTAQAFQMSSAGTFVWNGGRVTNGGLSTNPSTVSAGILALEYLDFFAGITTSGTAKLGLNYVNIDTSSENVTALTLGGSNSQQLIFSRIASGTASAISISSQSVIENCIVASTNTNAITGSGVVTYGDITFENSSSTINTTTQIPLITTNTQSNSDGFYGDGSDGSQVFNGSSVVLGITPSSNVYTLARDIYLASSSISSGASIMTNGFRIFCNGTLTNNGTIEYNGNIGTVGGAGGVAFTNSTSSINPSTNTGQGISSGGGAGGTGVGTAGVNGVSAIAYGGLGQAGGSGVSAGGAASTHTTGTSVDQSLRALPWAITGINLASGATITKSQGGTGGGGGGGDAVFSGGGGGGGAGMIIMAVYLFSGTGAIQAVGGVGGAGAVGATNAGGGGGGGGGLIVIVSRSVISSSISGQTLSVAGGSGGAGTGLGATGTTGLSGTMILLPN